MSASYDDRSRGYVRDPHGARDGGREPTTGRSLSDALAEHAGQRGQAHPQTAADPRQRPTHPDARTATGAPPAGAAGQAAQSPAEPLTGPSATGPLVAPAREGGKRRKSKSGASGIVPAESVTGSSLTLVIAIMCFLACLTAGAVYLINQSAAAWTRNIASEVTVQLQPLEGVDIEKRTTEVALFLARVPGIAQVTPLGAEVSQELLEPWLGEITALDAIAVPRLIALEIDRRAPPDLKEVGANLSRRFPGAVLDDHRQWQSQIRAVTRSMALGGLAILILVGAATMLIIISATRASMASNRGIVEVLHFVGATDRFIAREFERHFLNLGIRAGLVGAAGSVLVFLLMPTMMQLLGGGQIGLSEVRRLIGTGSIDLPGYFLLGIVVVVIAGICMLTSRFSVFRFLHARH
ncbi:MAG: ABC transporter permease [Pseudomonadota bacterium]